MASHSVFSSHTESTPQAFLYPHPSCPTLFAQNLGAWKCKCLRSQSRGLGPHESQLQPRAIAVKGQGSFRAPPKPYQCMQQAGVPCGGGLCSLQVALQKNSLLSPCTLPLSMWEIRGIFIDEIGKKHIPNLRITLLVLFV